MNCSNNILDGSGKHTRYTCFKRGIGKGRRHPFPWSTKRHIRWFDRSSDVLNEPYEPVFDNKVWCGQSEVFDHQQYQRAGSPYECLQKGVGVGRTIRMTRYPEFVRWNRVLTMSMLICICIIIIICVDTHMVVDAETRLQSMWISILIGICIVLTLYIWLYVMLGYMIG